MIIQDRSFPHRRLAKTQVVMKKLCDLLLECVSVFGNLKQPQNEVGASNAHRQSDQHRRRWAPWARGGDFEAIPPDLSVQKYVNFPLFGISPDWKHSRRHRKKNSGGVKMCFPFLPDKLRFRCGEVFPSTRFYQIVVFPHTLGITISLSSSTLCLPCQSWGTKTVAETCSEPAFLNAMPRIYERKQ